VKLKTFYDFSLGFISLSVLLCIPVAFMWILGTPGHTDPLDEASRNFASGWQLGFNTIVLYFISSIFILLIYSVSKLISRKIKISDHFYSSVIGVFWLIFIISIFSSYKALDLIGLF